MNIAYIHILYFVFSCIMLPFWRNKVHIYYGPNTAVAQTQTTNFFVKTVSLVVERRLELDGRGILSLIAFLHSRIRRVVIFSCGLLVRGG